MPTTELNLTDSLSIAVRTKALRLAECSYKLVLRSGLLQKLVYSGIRLLSPSRLSIENISLHLNKNDAVLNALLLLGLFEVPETIIFKKLLQPGMTFLDVGANIGYFSALASSFVGEKGTVIALEPEPKNQALLQKTSLSNPGPKYHLFQLAASSKSGSSTFYVSSSNCGDNRLADSAQQDDNDEWNSITVACVTLDELFIEKDLPLPDVIKIDVQGFEADVIAGCMDILKRKKAITLMIEFWPEGLRAAGKDPLELLRTLRDHEFLISYINLKGQLIELSADEELVKTYHGKAYTNLFCTRKTT
jgi:FkbM family methyltransferase